MQKTIVSFGQSSILYNSPNWRYQLYKSNDPLLQGHSRTVLGESDSRYKYTGKYMLRVLGDADIRMKLHPNCYLNKEFYALLEELTPKQRQMFWKIHSRSFKVYDEKKEKYAWVGKFEFAPVCNKTYCEYRLNKIDDIQDVWLRRLLRFIMGYSGDKAVDEAIKLNVAPDKKELMRFLSYYIFLGKTDREIAKTWPLKASTVEAIRMLFWDFSRMPKDPIVRTAFFRQLVQNSPEHSDVDFEFFKLLDDLGTVGLQGLHVPHLLSSQDRLKIDTYLGSSMLKNILEIKMAVKNKKDALDYNVVMNSLANIKIKQSEIGVNAAREENMRVATQKMQMEMGTVKKDDTQHKAINEALAQTIKQITICSLQETPQPPVRQIQDLKNS